MTWYPAANYSRKLADANGHSSGVPPEGWAGPRWGIWLVRRATPGLGEEFLTAVEATFDAIEQLPEMFGRVHGEVRRANVSRFPYAVFYRIEPRVVVVLTILHTARDPNL